MRGVSGIQQGAPMERSAVFRLVGLRIVLGSCTDRRACVRIAAASRAAIESARRRRVLAQFGPVLNRELEQRVAPVQVQLDGDVVAVVFDCPDADMERGGDLSAGLPFGDQLEDAGSVGVSSASAGFCFVSSAARRPRRMRNDESAGLTYS